MKKDGMQRFVHRETYVFFVNSIPFNGDTVKSAPLGGSESAAIYMAKELQQLGKKVLVFSRNDAPGHYEGVEYLSIEQFAHFIQRNIIDVFISVRNIDVFDLPIHARLKMLWMHDACDQPHVQALADQHYLNKIDKIITVSVWQTEQFERVFNIPREKFFISRNGVNKKYFTKYPKKRCHRLIYTSTPFRGLEFLLECFPFIKKRVPDAELSVYSSMKVYGMSDEEDKIRFGNLYAKCQQDGVILHGSIRQDELARRLGECYLWVYPNYFPETSCIAALEAQAAGLPCVASALGALPETIADGKTGTLIEGDVSSIEFKRQFIERIIAYFEDEALWQAHSQTAHEQTLASSTWDRIAQEWVTAFDQGKPTLSLCMIVKNESQTIKKCLACIEPLVDEIVLVDTGSRDDTVACAQTFDKVRVYHYKWNNDFAAARNFSLSHATCDWSLVLDADECIAERDFVYIRRLLNVKESVAYKFIQRSYINDPSVSGWKVNNGEYDEGREFAGYHESFLVRLFRNKRSFAFEGNVHETIENSIITRGFLPTNTNFPIHHFGKIGAVEKETSKGQAYLEIGKQKVKEHQNDPNAYKELAIQYAELGMITEAKACYGKVLEMDPDNIVALNDLAVLYLKEDKHAVAIEYLKKAIEINPRYVPAYVNCGLAYKEQGDLVSAKDQLEAVLAFDKTHTLVWKELGAIYFKLRKFGKACEHFRHLKKVAPDLYSCDEAAWAHYEMGNILLRNNDIKFAQRYFEEAMEIKKTFPEAMSALGITHVRANAFEQAQKQFKELIAVCTIDEHYKSEVVTAYLNLGYIENYLGNFEAAIKYLERAIELDHADAEAFNHLGIAKCGLGALEEAVSFFEIALKINPEHAGARTNLRRVKELYVKNVNLASQQGYDRNVR
jgi:tetratricopeptide (TPR) repeat protein/glycosyltransferase involved in cell wall biosynthesis